MSLNDFLLSAVPDTTEVLDSLGIGPFQGRKITSDGGVFFDPVAEEFDAVFSQPVPVDSDIGQEAAESLDFIEWFFEPVFGRARPSGEAGGPGGDQELDTSPQRSFSSRIHFPREVTEGYFDLPAEVFERSLDT